MMNRVVLVGRMTKDPELKYTPNGIAVATFTLAVNRNFSNGEGEREADFLNCVVWRKPAENVCNFTKKGSLVGVDGRLQSRSYEGTDGKRVYITEVVCDSVQFLEPKKEGQPQPGNQQQEQQAYFSQNFPQTEQHKKYQQQPQSFSTPGAQQRQQSNFKGGNNSFYNAGTPIDISDDRLPWD